MSRARLWRQAYLYCTVILATYSLVIADNAAATGQLTFCDQQSRDPRSLVFISTLDGKISALDAGNRGQKQWTLDLNDGPMLSSSIHRRELNNNGQWVRLIPSLSGGLYKFDGEDLEAVPVSTDQLLHSSFRYSDDLVFSGAKEIRSYGVSASTGKILYKCSVSGCMNNTDDKRHSEQEVLVIKRFQQTVRAVEARTGTERWNFSVGQHKLSLTPPANVYCPSEVAALDIEIKAIIPEGLIWAVNKSNPTLKLWQYKFDSPIVSIWRKDASEASRNQGSLEEINLFDSSQWVWGSEYSPIGPSLYVGMHDRQLYVQENSKLKDLLDSPPKSVQRTKYPWQPYPAVGTAVVSSLPDKNGNDEVPVLEIDTAQSTTALSALYNTEYINGNGFYLFSKDKFSDDKQCNGSDSDVMLITGVEKPMLTYTEEEDDTPVQVIIVSLWYWWKEVVIISITSAILLNFMLTQRLLNATTVAKDAVLPPLIVERHVETKRGDTPNDKGDGAEFKSRYLTDFEPVDCLGKGGYGVVFEARNKIDDCNYAIKRIALPNSRDSRERVMREVKALAKLDHHNIVRYFNAWLECPPRGWQEEHDQRWINTQKFLSSGFPSEVTQTGTKPVGSVCIDVSQTDPSSVDSACEAFELNNSDANEDSLVVFEDSNWQQRDNDAVCINAGSTDGSDSSFTSDEIEEASLDYTNHSEDIVFEATENNISEKKTEECKRQKPLNVNDKSGDRKSTKMFLYIQMQLCQRRSLREWLKQQSSARDPLRILNIFQQIIDAVEYVHLQGLIHRDLKPSNIFFAYDDKIKIGDFGLVTAMTEGCNETHTSAAGDENLTSKNNLHTAHVGTHLYMSPEQMNGQIYNYKVDIYSLGIIFFELLTPFFTDMERIIALSNLRKAIFPNGFAANHPAEYDLLKMMLDGDPAKRPTTLGIKARPPLQNYEIANGFNIDEDAKWHFELPQLNRHSSITSSSSNSESW